MGGREELCPHRSSPGVIVEDILDALAMVDVPVDNENPEFRQRWRLLKVTALPPSGSDLQLHLFLLSLGPHTCSSISDTPLQPIFLLGMLGCYSHIVEHTESIGSCPLTMMPWRPGVYKKRRHGASQSHSVPSQGHTQTARGGGQFSPHQGNPIVHSSC